MPDIGIAVVVREAKTARSGRLRKRLKGGNDELTAFDCHRRYTFARVEKGEPEADHGGASTYNQEDQPYAPWGGLVPRVEQSGSRMRCTEGAREGCGSCWQTPCRGGLLDSEEGRTLQGSRA